MTTNGNGQRREIVTFTVRDEEVIRAEIQQNARAAQFYRLRGESQLARHLDAQRESLWEELRACLAGCRNPIPEFERWAAERRVFRQDADA